MKSACFYVKAIRSRHFCVLHITVELVSWPTASQKIDGVAQVTFGMDAVAMLVKRQLRFGG